MATMRRILGAMLITSLVSLYFPSTSSAQADPPILLTLYTQETSGVYFYDPPGLPAPLGRTRYDSGNVYRSKGGPKIGEYVRVVDNNANSYNVGALTITVFFEDTGTYPASFTIQGAHDFAGGVQNESGSVSAAIVPELSGLRWVSTLDPESTRCRFWYFFQ